MSSAKQKSTPWRIEERLILGLKELVRMKQERGERTSVTREAHEAIRRYVEREKAELRNRGAE